MLKLVMHALQCLLLPRHTSSQQSGASATSAGVVIVLNTCMHCCSTHCMHCMHLRTRCLLPESDEAGCCARHTIMTIIDADMRSAMP
jgi:hypothetical protein